MVRTLDTYLNPVTPHSCPDPFVLKYRGEYWCYCTGIWHDGRCFGILRSPDLVHWTDLGGAMEPLEGAHSCYWAPETVYADGQFYLYYSVGDETNMAIRVAVADRPEGPFLDSGRQLTSEPFAIDPHIFQDEDGRRFLFYAVDFLEHTHIGTGTVRDVLLDPFTLANQPQPVTRARYDWQVFDPQRKQKGGVRWHTVEGSFVLKRKGHYYHMFSAGNWQDVTYGVGYSITDDLEQSDEWQQVCDGEQVLPILRTMAEHGVVGPGHNSVVRGPDNRQLWIVYHRWTPGAGDPGTEQGRAMAIDRLEWVGERMFVLGPTTTPQPVPFRPTIAYFYSAGPSGDEAVVEEGLGSAWDCRVGSWKRRGGLAVQEISRPGSLAEARLSLPVPSFLLEITLRALPSTFPRSSGPRAFGLLLDGPASSPDDPSAGNQLEGDLEEAFGFEVLPRSTSRTATVLATVGPGERRKEFPLNVPSSFASEASHLVRLEVDGTFASLAVDGLPLWQGRLFTNPSRLALFTRGTGAEFAGLELTAGWEHLFYGQDRTDLADWGWQVDGEAWIEREGLQLKAIGDVGRIRKAVPLTGSDYEWVVNLRLDPTAPDSSYGFYPALNSSIQGPWLSLQQDQGRWTLVAAGASEANRWQLPPDFDPFRDQQFRFWKRGPRLMILCGSERVGELVVPEAVSDVGLSVQGGTVVVDAVRLVVSSQ